MKKLLLLILPVLAMSFAACDKDDDSGDNTFSINGKSTTLNLGMMEYYGYEYSDNTVNIDLMLANLIDETGVWFEMHVPKGNTKLVAGTYRYDEYSYEAFTFSHGGAADSFEDEYEVIEGTVVIKVSGSTYTITINCKLENGGVVKGTYKGSLIWIDESYDY